MLRVVAAVTLSGLLAASSAAQNSCDQCPQLIAKLSDPKQADVAELRLVQLGASAVPALIEHLDADPVALVRNRHDKPLSRTATILAKIGTPAIPSLLAAYKSAHPMQEYTVSRDQNSERETFADPIKDRKISLNQTISISTILNAIGPDAFSAEIDLFDEQLGGGDFQSIWSTCLDPPNFGPWWRSKYVSPRREACKRALTPLLPRINKLLDAQLRDFGVADDYMAAILIHWGTGKLREAGTAAMEKRVTGIVEDNAHFDVTEPSLHFLAEVDPSRVAEIMRVRLNTTSSDSERDEIANWLLVLHDDGFHEAVSPLLAQNVPEYIRGNAIRRIEESQDLGFIPELIELQREKTIVAEQSRSALMQMTLLDLGRDPERWQRWYRQSSLDHKVLLQQFVSENVPKLAMMTPDDRKYLLFRVDEKHTLDPILLPLLEANLRIEGKLTAIPAAEDDCCLDRSFPWHASPQVITLLLGLAQQGSRRAIDLLYEGTGVQNLAIRFYSALALVDYDPKVSLDTLFAIASLRQRFSDSAIEALLRLHDKRGIDFLVQDLRVANDILPPGQRARVMGRLRQYTQMGLDYDPEGGQDERSSNLQEWLSWWKENRAQFPFPTHAIEIDDYLSAYVK